MHDKLTLVLTSGGVDSTTLLYVLTDTTRVVPVFIDYAQRAARRERAVSSYHASVLGLELRHLDLSALGESMRREQRAKLHIPLPHRNLVVLSVALSYATQIGADEIAIATIKEDLGGYASASRQFFAAFVELARSLGNISISAPLLDHEKTRVIRSGLSHGIDYAQTHSCMVSQEQHCGRCSQCLSRRRAFRAAGVTEPEGFYAQPCPT
ncbi:MAG TPA: 7-cyano-7-deazaguanine synthase [Polyangiaceae bacterium]|nr:7-cyano-7-deazaguanine synthase [Polyangiaceae bacterium]